MLIIQPDTLRRGAKCVRFACSDPRVGCVLYKMYVATTPAQGTESSPASAPVPKRDVSMAIAESSLACRATPVGALYAGHALYVSSVAYLRRVTDVRAPSHSVSPSDTSPSSRLPAVEELRRFVKSDS